MTPRLTKLAALYLPLGLVTTWAVAWGLAARFRVSDAEVRFDAELRDDMASVAARDDWSTLAIGLYRAPGSVRRIWSEDHHLTDPDDLILQAHTALGGQVTARDAQSLSTWAIGGAHRWGSLAQQQDRFVAGKSVGTGFDEAHGLPALAFAAQGRVIEDPESRLVLQAAIDLSTPDTPPFAPRLLPLLPIWPGLAFNTLFYALLWYLALASARMVSHNRRYRRGLCPFCRYDLRADYSQGCSECGWKR
jgi:hypothetical protein